jgi:cytosine permease
MSTQRKPADSDYSFAPVPQTARKGFWTMFVIMLGFTFFSASMSVGAKMGNGLDLSGFAWAVLIGGAILAAYTGTLGFIGSKSGLSFDLLAQRSFGKIGSFLPSALIAFTQIGWFGVGVAMFALPAADVLHVHPALLVALAGACMTASAYFGIKGMEIVSYVSVPLIAVLGVYSMALAASQSGGLAELFAKSGGTSIGLLAAVGMVVGSFVSGGTATPNFTRFAKNANVAVVTTVVAFFLGNTLMFAFGAFGGACTGKDDIFYVMLAQGLIVPALIVLGANIWTTNDNALYTSGLGLSNITKVRKKPLVILAGVIGTASAIWLYDNFIGWLSFLNATLPPIGALVILDWFLHPEKYRADREPTETVNPGACLGVVAGALVGNVVPWGIAAVNAMAAACATNLLCNKMFRK